VRELLWVLIGVLSAYVAYQLWRYVVLRREPVAETPFQAALDFSSVRHEIDALREDLSRQRAALTGLSQGLEGLREQLESVTAAQGISPEYNEALVCARRGLDVEAIAERCGISVAEAELVRSLADRQEGSGEPER
jgi:hypothetical protein